MASSSCCPILSGDAALAARRKAFEIACQLEQLPAGGAFGLDGDAGIALLLAYCDRPTAFARLETALHSSVRQIPTISLFSGISGVSWLLGELASGPEAEALIAHFDGALWSHLWETTADIPYDLAGGLVGVGVCMAGRGDARSRRIADLVLTRLESTAAVDSGRTTWYTSPRFLHESWRELFPDGLVDLGVAHGIPGIIGMLAQFIQLDLQAERSRKLLESTASWLLESIPLAVPRFGSHWPGGSDEPKRIGWCRGDAGVAGVLLHAAQVLASAELQREALRLLKAISAPLLQDGLRDAGFCHGIAGLAHIYSVAFRRSGDAAMFVEAERWLARLLSFQAPGAMGFAGYASLRFQGDVPRWEADSSLLTGAVGIALVLLAATEAQEPSWQRLFVV
jgi:lantibiotic biosynthesis protein